jgi:hypothetical protein
VAGSDPWTVQRYYCEWIERQRSPLVRASAARDYRSHFGNYILQVLGDVALEELSLAHLEDLRTTMRKHGLSDKTIRNAIDGSFRAMVRDAGQDDIPIASPFMKVRWPQKIVPGPLMRIEHRALVPATAKLDGRNLDNVSFVDLLYF